MKIKDSFQLDFVGIGVARSGTTWLANMLRDIRISLSLQRSISTILIEITVDLKIYDMIDLLSGIQLFSKMLKVINLKEK
ncbi:MAG: hypothetical protein ACFFBD_18320 [Candidatus Hodarchaeota archaeon]